MSRVDGFLPLRKPPGITSFQALTPIKKLLPRTKVGHTGTLDRFASGLLLVVCGRMTRLVPALTGLPKEYIAEVYFGTETETLDPEGDVVAQGPVPSLESIERAAAAFVGEIDQVPPQYSAVHVDGERAHRAARAGRSVTIAPRRVTIERLELLDFAPPKLRLRVACSSGTYVRSLARDIGHACGSYAHLSQLERTRVGPFELTEAIDAEEFLPERDLRPWRACLSRLPDIAQETIGPALAETVRQGGRVELRMVGERLQPQGLLAVYDEGGEFLALMRREGTQLRYEFVAAAPSR